jgi:hypothetical protein
VQLPVHRSIPVNSQGNPPTSNDCSGIYSIDMNAFAIGSLGGSPAPGLRSVGTLVTCQWWGRDPGFIPSEASALTSGIQYFVCP